MSKGNVVISSEYIELTENFYHKKVKKPILVYVEGDPDVRFWATFFKQFRDNYDISIRRAFDIATDDGKKGNGCSRISSLINSGQITLGPQLLTCIDSDYRFILNDYTNYEFVNSPYAFETRVCAKENVSSMSEGIQDIIIQATSLTNWFANFSVEWFFKNLSRALYPCQMLYLFLLRSNSTQAKKIRLATNSNITLLEKEFKKLEFNEIDKDILNIKLRKFRKGMHSIFKNYFDENSKSDFTDFTLKLRKEKKILSCDTTYFLRGHDFYDLIFSSIVSHLAHTIVIDEKAKRLASNDDDGIKQLFKSQQSTKTLIESRKDLEDCKFFHFTVEKINSTLSQ